MYTLYRCLSTNSIKNVRVVTWIKSSSLSTKLIFFFKVWVVNLIKMKIWVVISKWNLIKIRQQRTTLSSSTYHHSLSCSRNNNVCFTDDLFLVIRTWVDNGNSSIRFQKQKWNWQSNYVTSANYNRLLSLYIYTTSCQKFKTPLKRKPASEKSRLASYKVDKHWKLT